MSWSDSWNRILSDVDDLKDFVGLILRFMDFLGERVFNSWYGSPCSADWKFCEKGNVQPRPQGAFPPPKPGKSALGTRLGNVWSRDFLGFCWKP